MKEMSITSDGTQKEKTTYIYINFISGANEKKIHYIKVRRLQVKNVGLMSWKQQIKHVWKIVFVSISVK